ncbi:MAG: hypothetical protein H8D78_17170 [Chloroflexi bacterium]|nr:hypothetical protein [Chloroflexota bacterium]
MQVGQIESVKRVFSQTDFNRFAALSGDDNPTVLWERTGVFNTLILGFLAKQTNNRSEP